MIFWSPSLPGNKAVSEPAPIKFGQVKPEVTWLNDLQDSYSFEFAWGVTEFRTGGVSLGGGWSAPAFDMLEVTALMQELLVRIEPRA